MPNWILPSWIFPEWMTIPGWVEPKLIVFFVLVGGVLFLSRDRGESVTNAERRFEAMLKHGKR
jgi:hypothetical protein